MIDLLFVVFLFIFLVYHYIWTGSCAMACRHSGYSRFSGMSGLNQPPAAPYETETPSTCVCESCPCAFIENVIRRCQPATNMCEQRMVGLSIYVASIMRVIADVYVTLMNTFDESSSSLRHAELVRNKDTYESNQNFTFDRDRTEKKIISKYDPRAPGVLPLITGVARKLTRSDTTLTKDLKDMKKMQTTTQSASSAPFTAGATAPSVGPSTAASLPTAPTSSTAPSASMAPKSYAPPESLSAPSAPPAPAAPLLPSSSSEPPRTTMQNSLVSSCAKCIADGQTCESHCTKKR